MFFLTLKLIITVVYNYPYNTKMDRFVGYLLGLLLLFIYIVKTFMKLFFFSIIYFFFFFVKLLLSFFYYFVLNFFLVIKRSYFRAVYYFFYDQLVVILIFLEKINLRFQRYFDGYTLINADIRIYLVFFSRLHIFWFYIILVLLNDSRVKFFYKKILVSLENKPVLSLFFRYYFSVFFSFVEKKFAGDIALTSYYESYYAEQERFFYLLSIYQGFNFLNFYFFDYYNYVRFLSSFKKCENSLLEKKKFVRIFSKAFYFDKIINSFLSVYFFSLSWNVFFRTIDKGLLELFGPIGISRWFEKIGLFFSRMQNGNLYYYFCTMLFSIILIILSFYLFFNN
jgi:hypothetical protein